MFKSSILLIFLIMLFRNVVSSYLTSTKNRGRGLICSLCFTFETTTTITKKSSVIKTDGKIFDINDLTAAGAMTSWQCVESNEVPGTMNTPIGSKV